MNSRILVGLLAAGCITGAAAGAYVAGRQHAVQPPAVTTSPAAATPTAPAAQPVAETEGVVGAPAPAQAPPRAEAPAAAPQRTPEPDRQEAARPAATQARVDKDRHTPPAARQQTPTPTPAAAAPAPPQSAPAAERPSAEPPPAIAPVQMPEPARASEVPAPAPVPQFEEVILPASSVVGLQVETPLSSERTRIEDRVDARVTRDVLADGRVAIPAGSRVIGSVTLVDRGGKVKERARLGVRFHTLVLADGSEIPLRTEAIYREGDSPAGESARKIGGAAIGGAILGAIMGGGKGAVLGGATGAAGGSAVVMTGDRNAATLPAGTVVTVRLTAPATIEVEKRDQ